MRVEGKAADDQQVEADALHGLLGGLLDLLRPDRAVLRADGDGHALALLPSFVGVLAGGVQPGAGVGLQPVELQALAS